MIFNFLIVAIVLGIGYAWLVRGFYSALIHLVCTVVAGAIAFGLWEPVAFFIIDKAPEAGFLSFVRDNAWGISLMLTFAIALAVLRVALDSILRANINISPAANYAGGGVCGLLSALIAAGVFATGAGAMRMPTKLLGYEPIDYSSSGLTRTASLWIPADKLVATLYGSLSDAVLYTPESLARWYPDLSGSVAATRMSYKDGKARNILAPSEFSIRQWYTIGKDSGNLQSLLRDRWDGESQQVADLDGESITNGYLAGFVIQLDAGAQEKKGKVVLGAGQVRLVVESSQTHESRDLYPVAVISQVDAANKGYARWRFNSKFHIWSAGGATRTTMAFEFAVPRGFEPIGLSVKNTRARVTGSPAHAFTTANERIDAIEDAVLFDVGAADFSDPEVTGSVARQEQGEGVSVNNTLPRPVIIQDGQQGGLETSGAAIIDGEARFEADQFKSQGNVPQELRIDRFYVIEEDTVVVQVDVSINSKQSLLGRAVQAAQNLSIPMLVDNNGTTYEPIGYFYRDDQFVTIRYTPGRPIRALTELQNAGVQLSRSRPEDALILIYRPTMGVTLKRLVIGQETIREFDAGGILLDKNQNNGKR